MGYTYSFMDNAQYSASDINSVLASLVTGGIADPFTDGVPYNATKLNEIISAVSSAGIVPETDTSCKCVIDNESHTVSIMKGMAFFNDGSRIVFDTEGETLEYTPGVKNFVYLKAESLENRNYPVCSTVALTGDVLLLAEIDEMGVLTDKRTYARGKLPGYQSNFNLGKKIEVEAMKIEIGKEVGMQKSHTIYTDSDSIDFAFLVSNDGSPTTFGKYDSSIDADGRMKFCQFIHNNTWYDSYFDAHFNYIVFMTITVERGSLVFNFTVNSNSPKLYGNFPPFTIYVF